MEYGVVIVVLLLAIAALILKNAGLNLKLNESLGELESMKSKASDYSSTMSMIHARNLALQKTVDEQSRAIDEITKKISEVRHYEDRERMSVNYQVFGLIPGDRAHWF